MPEFTVDISFDVYCSKCGASLCGNSDTNSYRGKNRLTVEPCDKCLDASYAEGRDAGYKLAEEGQEGEK